MDTETADIVSFDIGAHDAVMVTRIAFRAQRMGLTSDRLSARMDLTAAHANGNPMDFDRLLVADDFNFAHDFCGIARHIDRETGKLTGFFVPRFSKPEAPEPTPRRRKVSGFSALRVDDVTR